MATEAGRRCVRYMPLIQRQTEEQELGSPLWRAVHASSFFSHFKNLLRPAPFFLCSKSLDLRRADIGSDGRTTKMTIVVIEVLVPV